MAGFSIYLDEDITQTTENYIQIMKKSGFNNIFTSLHIPEDNPTLSAERIKKLATLCQKYNLELTIDVDKASLQNTNSSLMQKNIRWRLDEGFSISEISELSHDNKLALNASTLTLEILIELTSLNTNFQTIEGWHNYYPRPDTGLDLDWFQQKNELLNDFGIDAQVFIPGDKDLRGPLYKGLPTLEKHRSQSSFSSFLELEQLGIHKIFISDKGILPSTIRQFQEYLLNKNIILYFTSHQDFPSKLTDFTFHSRPDLSRDVIRLMESRSLFTEPISPNYPSPRTPGSITIDNDLYGRYHGEVQLIKNDLPIDEKVNIIGNIRKEDLPILKLIQPNQAIILEEN